MVTKAMQKQMVAGNVDSEDHGGTNDETPKVTTVIPKRRGRPRRPVSVQDSPIMVQSTDVDASEPTESLDSDQIQNSSDLPEVSESVSIDPDETEVIPKRKGRPRKSVNQVVETPSPVHKFLEQVKSDPSDDTESSSSNSSPVGSRRSSRRLQSKVSGE